MSRERRLRLREAMAELPVEQRQVLELAFYAGLTQSEIASRESIPLGTVKTRTLLAMRKLRVARTATSGEVSQQRTSCVVVRFHRLARLWIRPIRKIPRCSRFWRRDLCRWDARRFRKVGNIRYKGVTAKVHLALSGLPDFTCRSGAGDHLNGMISISPSLEYVERAFDAAKYGRTSERPCLEISIPSLADPSVAPDGKHLMSIAVQYAPYHRSDGTWDDAARDQLGDLTVRTIAEYAPNLESLVESRHVLTPLDLERRFGLHEGNVYHGEMTLDQLLFMRPVPGAARYRTPVSGLYLCGAGTHPGGGVIGVPGLNAAREILRDR